jgi:hypothetical protein
MRPANSAFETDSFLEFILGWTIGGSARVSRAGLGVAPEPLVEPFSLGNGFRRDAENGNRDGRAPQQSPSRAAKGNLGWIDGAR